MRKVTGIANLSLFLSLGTSSRDSSVPQMKELGRANFRFHSQDISLRVFYEKTTGQGSFGISGYGN